MNHLVAGSTDTVHYFGNLQHLAASRVAGAQKQNSLLNFVNAFPQSAAPATGLIAACSQVRNKNTPRLYRHPSNDESRYIRWTNSSETVRNSTPERQLPHFANDVDDVNQYAM
jgi:hypothetical protein